jgi:class 3 adenylate cyclase
MSPIFHHNGTIDRLLGNRLIAVFGAPLEDHNKERNAVNAAIEMRRAQAELNRRWALTGEQQFRLGVGIHTGSALLGNIGSSGNIEFTVLGSSVDVASLIGSENSNYKTDALVSETTVDAIRGEFGFDEVGDIQPSGFSDFIRVYSVRQLATASS